MGKKRKHVFLDTGEVLFVKVEAVMHPLIPFSDGLVVHKFPKQSSFYLTVDEAIRWCRKEVEYSHDPSIKKALAALESAKQTHTREQAIPLEARQYMCD